MAMEKKKAEKQYEVCVGRWQRVGSATLNTLAQGRHHRERGTLRNIQMRQRNQPVGRIPGRILQADGRMGTKALGHRYTGTPKMLERIKQGRKH